MENYQFILLMIYLCVNCFLSGIEYEKNGMSKWVYFGVLFYIPACIIAFIILIIQLFRGKDLI